jgi:endoglucanase
VQNSSNPQRQRRRLTGLLSVGAAASLGLITALGGATTATAAPAHADSPALAAELIQNGDFESGATAPWWWTEPNPATIVDGQLCADNAAGTTNPWDAIIGQDGIALTAGESYTLSYSASATSPVTITTNVQEAAEPYTQQFSSNDALTPELQTFEHTFTATAEDPAAQLVFQFGGGAEDLTFCVDDISLADGAATR